MLRRNLSRQRCLNHSSSDISCSDWHRFQKNCHLNIYNVQCLRSEVTVKTNANSVPVLTQSWFQAIS